MPIPIFLDTSVLPRNATGVSAEYRALVKLSQENEVIVYISTIVYNEWITQKKHLFLKKVETFRSATGDLLRDKWSPFLEAHDQLNALKIWFDENGDTVETAAEDSAASVLNHLNPTILPVTGDHATSTLDGYFGGRPPFASVKSRNDIPDAFIFEALRHLPVPDGEQIHAAINDSRLRDAARTLQNVETYSSLKTLFESPALVTAQTNLSRAAAWRAWLDQYRPHLDTLSPAIADHIRRTAVDALAGKTVSHAEIPDDNREGTITMIDDAQNIEVDWNDVEEFAVGILSIPITFEVDVLIDFYVYRMDAYDVPDGVSVSFGDPENDYYYAAEAHVSVQVTTEAVFRISEHDIDNEEYGRFDDFSFAGEMTIEVIEDDSQKIFL